MVKVSKEVFCLCLTYKPGQWLLTSLTSIIFGKMILPCEIDILSSHSHVDHVAQIWRLAASAMLEKQALSIVILPKLTQNPTSHIQ